MSRIIRSCGQPAAGGLEADEPVDRGRDPDRAAAVVGVRDRHRTGGDEGGGARRRGAGVVVGAPRASGPARAARGRRRRRSRTPRAGSCRAGSARWRGTSGRSRRRPACGCGGERVGAVLGGHAGHVDVVLDEGRDAREPAAARVPGLARGRGRRRRTPRRRGRRRPARCGRSRPRRPPAPTPPRRAAPPPARWRRGRSGRRRRRRRARGSSGRRGSAGRPAVSAPAGDSPRGGRRRGRWPPSGRTSWSGPTWAKPAFLSALDRATDSGEVVGTSAVVRGAGPGSGRKDQMKASSPPCVAQGDGGAGVGDRGVDLAAVAHDAGVGHQALDVAVVEGRDRVGVEAGEGGAEVRRAC